MLEELDRRGILKNPVFISGVSSGALNAVMLNGILSGKMSWEQYKRILFSIKNEDIFTLIERNKHGERMFPLNTSPARSLYKNLVEVKLGYSRIGDLPFFTEISITHLKDPDLKKSVYRMCSRKINKETDTTLNLVDIMMASSAFPYVFPPVKINNVKTIPDVTYVDGGLGEDHVPYHALLEFEKYRGSGVEKVYIISRKSDKVPELSEELKGLGINDKGIFDKLGISMDGILSKGITKGIEAFSLAEPELMKNTYVWIPDFNANFMFFNFDHLEDQYLLTSEWAKTHDPITVGEYLTRNKIKR